MCVCAHTRTRVATRIFCVDVLNVFNMTSSYDTEFFSFQLELNLDTYGVILDVLFILIFFQTNTTKKMPWSSLSLLDSLAPYSSLCFLEEQNNVVVLTALYNCCWFKPQLNSMKVSKNAFQLILHFR